MGEARDAAFFFSSAGHKAKNSLASFIRNVWWITKNHGAGEENEERGDGEEEEEEEERGGEAAETREKKA